MIYHKDEANVALTIGRSSLCLFMIYHKFLMHLSKMKITERLIALDSVGIAENPKLLNPHGPLV